MHIEMTPEREKKPEQEKNERNHSQMHFRWCYAYHRKTKIIFCDIIMEKRYGKYQKRRIKHVRRKSFIYEHKMNIYN